MKDLALDALLRWMFYDNYKDCAPQHLQWIFDTTIKVRQQWPTHATRQWLITWTSVLFNAVNPGVAPSNLENYPYSTALETG